MTPPFAGDDAQAGIEADQVGCRLLALCDSLLAVIDSSAYRIETLFMVARRASSGGIELKAYVAGISRGIAGHRSVTRAKERRSCGGVGIHTAFG
jgi:hypothetical protein